MRWVAEQLPTSKLPGTLKDWGRAGKETNNGSILLLLWRPPD